jgi:hypothetical protein
VCRRPIPNHHSPLGSSSSPPILPTARLGSHASLRRSTSSLLEEGNSIKDVARSLPSRWRHRLQTPLRRWCDVTLDLSSLSAHVSLRSSRSMSCPCLDCEGRRQGMELPLHQGPIAFWRVVRAESREMSFVHAFLHGCGKFPSCRIEKSSTLHKMYRPAGTSALRVAFEGTCHFFLSCHRDTLNSSISDRYTVPSNARCRSAGVES